MKFGTLLSRVALATAAIAGPLSVSAQTSVTQAPANHAGHHAAQHVGQDAAGSLTDGEIRRIDKANGKVTIRHAEIKHLDMPPMSMVFQVRDAAMLDGLSTGDRIRFGVVQESGAYVVTEIRPAR